MGLGTGPICQLGRVVLARKGTLVVRPDSGDPKTVVVQSCEKLGEAFGATKNDKGYLVLNDKVRLIQGDGISWESIGDILAHLEQSGWSTDNVVFGSGGGLLQRV